MMRATIVQPGVIGKSTWFLVSRVMVPIAGIVLLNSCVTEIRPPLSYKSDAVSRDRALYGPPQTDVETVSTYERRITVRRSERGQNFLTYTVKSETRTVFINVTSRVIYPNKNRADAEALRPAYLVARGGARPEDCYYCFKVAHDWYRTFLATPNRPLSTWQGKIIQRFPWKPDNGPLPIVSMKGRLAVQMDEVRPGLRTITVRPINGFTLLPGKNRNKVIEHVFFGLDPGRQRVDVSMWRN